MGQKRKLTTKEAIEIAGRHMKGLAGHEFDLLTIAKPVSPEAAPNLAKVIFKLSPLLGNLIKFNTGKHLSDKTEFEGLGKWRQDPGFPDAIFEGDITPTPGFEIKTWFPLATEITARFKGMRIGPGGGRRMPALGAGDPPAELDEEVVARVIAACEEARARLQRSAAANAEARRYKANARQSNREIEANACVLSILTRALRDLAKVDDLAAARDGAAGRGGHAEQKTKQRLSYRWKPMTGWYGPG